MSNTKTTCPKCEGEMVQGFLADFMSPGVSVALWVEGPPKKSWAGVKLEPRKKIPVATYRCNKCGYLESYARKEFAAK
jgi:hypothetical protein